MKAWTRLALVGLLGIACMGARANEGQVQESFRQGNKFYEAGEFEDAAAAYEKCLAAGGTGADVLYNLGNAYARQRMIGRALAAYHAGLRRAPRDEDLLNNIDQVATLRAEVAPQIPRSWLAAVGHEVVSRHTLNELVGLALVLLVVCTGLGLALLERVWPPRRVLMALTGVGILALLSAWACGAKYHAECVVAPAFVSVEQATLRSGPGEHFEITGHLTDGARVVAERQSGLWSEVVLGTGKHAWLRDADLARVSDLARGGGTDPAP